MEHRAGDFPNAEAAARAALALPLFPGLGRERVDRIGAALSDFFR
jgi:dTDP-4-amino-4,6-dideoxygalactose transaminase